jgi:hypothetical protein
MTRKWLLALLALFIVTPAVAQLVVRPIQRPVQVQPVPAPNSVQQDSDAAQKIMTVEEAQARIAQLNREKRELNARLTETLATIDQWTKKGGSLVHAYCESEDLSRNSAGETENCAASGYRCAAVEGTCRKSCNVTTDCAGYHVCDTAAHVCVRA